MVQVALAQVEINFQVLSNQRVQHCREAGLGAKRHGSSNPWTAILSMRPPFPPLECQHQTSANVVRLQPIGWRPVYHCPFHLECSDWASLTQHDRVMGWQQTWLGL